MCAEGRALPFWDPKEVLWLEILASWYNTNTTTLFVRNVSDSRMKTSHRLCLPSNYHCSSLKRSFGYLKNNVFMVNSCVV